MARSGSNCNKPANAQALCLMSSMHLPAPPANVDNMLEDMLAMLLMIGLFVSEAAI